MAVGEFPFFLAFIIECFDAAKANVNLSQKDSGFFKRIEERINIEKRNQLQAGGKMLDVLPFFLGVHGAEDSSMISIVAPTRKRPANVKRLLESLRDTSTHFPEVIFYVDDDDQHTQNEIDAIVMGSQLPNGSHVKFVIGPRITMSDCWNHAAVSATGDILMVGADDLVFRTKGWDEIVQQGFDTHPDKIIYAFGDDGVCGRQHGTHGFVHRRWINTVGYFVPSGFGCDYVDTWLNDVARMIDRMFPVPILTEHMHFLWGKAEQDETHTERLARAQQTDYGALYWSRESERNADAERLKAAIGAASVSAINLPSA